MNHVVVRLAALIPAPIQSILKGVAFNKISSRFWDKSTAELMYQAVWAKEFKTHIPAVLEYWKTYRHLDEIKAICNVTDETKVLDVGCGISTVLHFLCGERYGIDPLADAYKRFYCYPNGIHIQKASGEAIPFPDGSFDVIFCSNVLDHTSDPQKTIDEIYRVLKPNGYFVLTVEVFEERQQRDAAHPHSLTRPDVHAMLDARFRALFEKESPWIGLRAYVNGSRKSHQQEIIVVSEKA